MLLAAHSSTLQGAWCWKLHQWQFWQQAVSAIGHGCSKGTVQAKGRPWAPHRDEGGRCGIEAAPEKLEWLIHLLQYSRHRRVMRHRDKL